MSKEIVLNSEDNKYTCAVELADSKDRFGCPDHSRIMLFEKRDNKIYLIAEARDRKLETEKDKRIAELEQELDQANERLPKFKKDDFVYALFTQTEIYKGQIDAFDYYTNSYLVFPNEDVGNEWIKADKVFKTKLEAEKKLQELRGRE